MYYNIIRCVKIYNNNIWGELYGSKRVEEVFNTL